MEEIMREAVSMGIFTEVEQLIEKGVELDDQDDMGNTYLHTACSVNEKAIVNLLIKRGANLELTDVAGNTPLHVACERGSHACAELLIENGARIDPKNEKKKTPLQLVKNKIALAKLKASAKASSPSSSSPHTPIVIPDDLAAFQHHLDQVALDLGAKQSEISGKVQNLLQRESELIMRERGLRAKEEEMKRTQRDLEAKLDSLARSKAQYDENEARLRQLVVEQENNEVVSAMSVVDWKSISLKSKLGQGAFAAVYKGVWRGTQVAIKKPFMSSENSCHGLPDEDLTELFNREIRILAKLRHPNIVTLMGACLEAPNHCMILELCKADLYTLLHDHSIALTPKKLLAMAIDVTQGLLYLHTHSPALVHRDVKSANMLMTMSGDIKLIDFGYATYIGEKGYVYSKHKLIEKANRGTPAYMAVECLRNEEYTTKSDVWSFGVFLWELMTRKTPWSGKSPEAIYAEVTTGSRLEVPKDSYFPEAYSELIYSCWLEQPEDRPSMKSILKSLKSMKKLVNSHPTQ